MNLPNVIKELVTAQQHRNSTEFVNCFTDDAMVYDEAKTHAGKDEIRAWMEQTTKEYNLSMKSLDFKGNEKEGIFKTEVSGTFPGSPIVFQYHMEFDGDLIRSLEITN